MTLNFHPDRSAGGRQILLRLADDGVYLSQFVTGTSNGGLTAHPGGDPDLLDDYIEAQVHGPVRLDRDVEALVLDPSYRGTAVEAAARRLPCPVEWHSGFRLTIEHLWRHPNYRGQEYVALGAEIAVDGLLDPRIIGDAVRTGRYGVQALKKVWHCVARFGSSLPPAGEIPDPHRPASAA
ncbi:DUF3626 domain-containing protein [Microbispora rosea]|uniref:DUF3626 domain-containing protein n=1 Tax=Microbispora rosea TaxID=58117 RepID=UPI00341F8066